MPIWSLIVTNFRYLRNSGFKGWSLFWGREIAKTQHSWLFHAFIWKLFSTKNNVLAPENLYLSLHHLKYNWQSAYIENFWKIWNLLIFRKPKTWQRLTRFSLLPGMKENPMMRRNFYYLLLYHNGSDLDHWNIVSNVLQFSRHLINSPPNLVSW